MGDKKVDTLEMIRLLMENPKRKAVKASTAHNRVKYCGIKGLGFIEECGRFVARVSLTPEILKCDWDIIEPEHGPVYFMEAFKAWQEQGKQIICKDKEGITLDRFLPFCLDDIIEARHILEGHWYIKDYAGRRRE